MFGGVSFMIRGYMACGVVKHDLVVRMPPESTEEATKRPGARPMDFTGRPMQGFVFVDPTGTESDEALRAWIVEAVRFVSSLPPKRLKKARLS
jgi:hypothetical protein